MYLLEIILIWNVKYKSNDAPNNPSTIVMLDCAACIELYFTLPRTIIANSQVKNNEQLNQKYLGLSFRSKLLKYIFFVSELSSPKK